ncbi:MAG: hypothetical protein ACREFE_19015, partial [Limisphaerales bacterium]
RSRSPVGVAQLVVVRRHYMFMKTYNTRLGLRVFTIIMLVDGLELVIGHFHPGGLLAIPALIINFPALLLMHFCEGLFQNGSLGMSGLFLGGLLFCAILWAVVVGYAFHRKSAA